MAKHIFEWDKRSHKPMIVVCTQCGKRMPLNKVIDEGVFNGCPGKVVQEGLFGDEPKD